MKRCRGEKKKNLLWKTKDPTTPLAGQKSFKNQSIRHVPKSLEHKFPKQYDGMENSFYGFIFLILYSGYSITVVSLLHLFHLTIVISILDQKMGLFGLMLKRMDIFYTDIMWWIPDEYVTSDETNWEHRTPNSAICHV